MARLTEIEPVAARDFLRFLFAWQRVTDDTRLEGPDAVPVAVALLEGFAAGEFARHASDQAVARFGEVAKTLRAVAASGEKASVLMPLTGATRSATRASPASISTACLWP